MVNKFVAVYFINQRQPLMAGKSYKKCAVGISYPLFNRHRIKLALSNNATSSANTQTRGETLLRSNGFKYVLS